MTVQIELEDDVEASLSAKANESGISLEKYIEDLLRQTGREDLAYTAERSELAAQRIRELRKGLTLGDISPRELIEEGRE